MISYDADKKFIFLTTMDAGAPYEDRGAIYLYHGGPDGLNTKPAQIVRYRESQKT